MSSQNHTRDYTNKQLLLQIINILKFYSDINHPLSRKDIVELLKKDPEQPIDLDTSDKQKSVTKNIRDLIDFGYDIEDSGCGKKNAQSKWYLNREFDDSEIRLLIDSLLFFKHIPRNQCEELISKLKGLSNKYFSDKVRHITSLPANQSENQQLFLTIEILNEAIAEKKKVAFHFLEYGIDKEATVVKRPDGNPKKYIVSPYQMVITNGRYYLICAHDKGDYAYHYRLDYVRDVNILDKEPIRPLRDVRELKNGLDLSKHMAEHIYMFSGESIRVKFLASKHIIGAILDWFGTDVVFTDVGEESVIATVTVKEKAMLYWALQYGKSVEVLEPASLREEIRQAVADMYRKYNPPGGAKS